MVRKKRTKAPKQESDELGIPEPEWNFEEQSTYTQGLVPVGLGDFYQSPVEPVDPRDCERWPNSPYCGGDILNDEFISVLPTISVNECEICVTLSPVLGKIALPPYTICKRRDNPACIPQIPKPPPTVEPGTPSPYQKRCKDGSYHYIGTTIEINLNGETFPVGTDYNTIAKATFDWQMADYVAQYGQPTEWRTAVSFVPDVPTLSDRRGMSSIYKGIKFLNDEMTFYDLAYEDVLISGSNWIGTFTYLQDLLPPDAMKGKQGSFTTSMNLSSIVYFNAQGCDEVPDTEGVRPPSYPPNRGCCMSCCSNAEQEELLKLIAKRVGVSDYPFKVPENLLANRSRKAKVLESNAQLWEWYIRQFDALAGQFPIEIEIEDNDPTKEGDQKQKIKVENISEALAELLGIGINANINTETLINIGIRTLTEAGQAKIAAIVAQDLARSNADFLDYDLKQIKRKIPLSFRPGKTELDDILKEGETEIQSYENVDKQGLKDYFTEFLQGVAIIRAAFWRKLDPNDSYAKQIKGLLKGIIGLSENEYSADKNGKLQEVKPEEDFDSFLEETERGFINKPGIQDSTNPYDRPPTQRPRIREIGKQQS